jgi:hypothetical protein
MEKIINYRFEDGTCAFCFNKGWVCSELDLATKKDAQSPCPSCNPHRPCASSKGTLCNKGEKCKLCKGTQRIEMTPVSFTKWQIEQHQKEITKLQKAKYQNSGLLDIYLSALEEDTELLVEFERIEQESSED